MNNHELVSEIRDRILRGDSSISIEINSTSMLLKLPSPQRSGTGFQQKTYAELEARQIVKDATQYANSLLR